MGKKNNFSTKFQKNKKLIFQHLGLIVFGLILGLIIIEIILRLSGALIISFNNFHDKPLRENVSNFNETYTILILGESTSEDLYGYSWPEQLNDYLNNKSLKKKIKIINKALGGINSGFLISYLPEFIKEYHPNMIITMMGINDNWSYIYYANKPPSKIKLYFEDLRVVKLFRLIYLNGKDNLSTKSNLRLDQEIENKYVKKGIQLSNEGNPKEAELAFKKAIELYPNDYVSYHKLGEFYFQNKEFNKSIIYLNQSVNLNPHDWISILQYALVLDDLHKVEDSIYVLENFILTQKKKNTNLNETDIIITQLIRYYEDFNETEKAEKLLKDRGFASLTSKNELDITKFHYNLLYNITQKNNITLVIMQYPTRNIEDFKSYFTSVEQKNIIFIENKKNFEEYKKNLTYDELFVDKFAFPKYKFGHCTTLGNKLIATNIANVILNEI